MNIVDPLMFAVAGFQSTVCLSYSDCTVVRALAVIMSLFY